MSHARRIISRLSQLWQAVPLQQEVGTIVRLVNRGPAGELWPAVQGDLKISTWGMPPYSKISSFVQTSKEMNFLTHCYLGRVSHSNLTNYSFKVYAHICK